jgi:hypothetical protein
MMQTSLFPQEVRNGQQPQRTASKAQASRPPVNDNRQAPAPAQQAAKRTGVCKSIGAETVANTSRLWPE